MNERTSFIGTWVSKQEKEEIIKLAKGMNISVSDLIRHRVIRPMMTLPEAIQNLKLHIDTKFKKFEFTITNLTKEQLFAREPTRRTATYIEEYEPVLPLPQKTINISSTKSQMLKVLKELKEMIQGNEFSLEEVPKEEIERKRAKTDQIAYLEFKTKTVNK